MSTSKELSVCLNENLRVLNTSFKDCPDVIQKLVTLKQMKKGCFIFIKDYVNSDLLQRDFIRPLLSMDYYMVANKNIIEYLPTLNNFICTDMEKVITSVLEGKTVFLLDGANFAVVCDLVDIENRAITEPEGEKNVKGSRDGFIESLSTNITLLRRRIKSSRLKFRHIVLGNVTHQNLAIAYIEEIANPEILSILYSKIKDIGTDGLISMGQVEQLITESKYSLFPQHVSTERVDKAVAALLEGRLVVLLEGTPIVLIAPISLFSLIQAPDDYSANWIASTVVRIIRILGMITTLILPGLYVSITAFQYYLIPIDILTTLARSRTGVAFPPAVEALVMEFTIQMMREASIRLPTYIGTTLGIVGGIIIGQAAVAAGIVSNVFIIVVGIMAIASYVTPDNNLGLALIVIRIIILIMSSMFGILGITVCLVLLAMHLLSLESLGQPYLSPIMPFKLRDLKDTFIKLPMSFMNKRPHITQPTNKNRGDNNE